jgi:ABC-type nitrate/sulfonate/bicarbonate transport system permease component
VKEKIIGETALSRPKDTRARSTAGANRQPSVTAPYTRALIKLVLTLGPPFALLLMWEIGTLAGWIKTQFFPAPTTIAVKFWESMWTDQFWSDLGISLQRMGIGFFMGGVPGLLLGLAMGLFRPVRILFQPLVAALYPLPKIALLPLILLIFGLAKCRSILRWRSACSFS